jgi:hypothetical protein
MVTPARSRSDQVTTFWGRCRIPPAGRHGRFDGQLEDITTIWANAQRGGADAVGPVLPGVEPPQLLIGGMSTAASRRVARYGAGWIGGGGGLPAVTAMAGPVRQAWANAGREGQPKLMSLTYFGLGAGARAQADAYLGDYYAFAGPYAERVRAGALVDAPSVQAARAAFEAAGCDEVIFFPTSATLDQIDQLADVLNL